MSTPREIEIIGGGLAGLALGLGLRRAGVPATVFEAGDYPRHRVCGEFITGLGEGTVARLGLAPLLADAGRLSEVEWFLGGRPLRRQRLPAPALALKSWRVSAMPCGRGALQMPRAASLSAQPPTATPACSTAAPPGASPGQPATYRTRAPAEAPLSALAREMVAGW